MLERGSETVASGGQTRSDGAGPLALGRRQHHNHQLQSDRSRFVEWIDSSLAPTGTISLVAGPSTVIKNHQKRCCRTSTSSGYSSHSPPPSAGSYSSACCPTLVIPGQRNLTSSSGNDGGSRGGNVTRAYHQQVVGIPGLAVIHEAETIPRPIWPCMADNIRDIHTSADSAARCDMIDCEVAAAHAAADPDGCRQDLYACCGYCCVCSAYAYRNSCGTASAASSSAREVLLELSRTLNAVIDEEYDLSPEEILRDISITVARGIETEDPPCSGIREDYTYRLSSSSSSAGGKESVGVNPANLRVYSKSKWLHVPASSRSSSHCPYERKTLLTAPQHASRRQHTFGGPLQAEQVLRNNGERVAPAIFLVPQRNLDYSSNTYPGKSLKVEDCNGERKPNVPGKFDGVKRSHPRLNAGPGEHFGDNCPAQEPIYSTQLDGSDESSSYGALGELPAKKGWNEGTKFDRHLDFTLDGNRAERLGRAIAKAKRKRQWCRGLTAIFGLVFFVLSVVVVSLSVTRGRKVFGSM